MRAAAYLQGLETRNVLIVGAGRVGHALRNHLESLRHMGFRFKGFIALTRSSDGGEQSADVIGDVRNCVAMARSLFVDEIYFSTPADKNTGHRAGGRGAGAGHRCARGAGSLRRSGVECACRVYRPVSDHSAAPPRFSDGLRF